jgi:hypothetical protein
MANTNFPLQSSKARSIKGFGENISQLSLCVNVSLLGISLFHMISQEVVLHFKVFHSFVEDKVFSHKDGNGVVTHEGNSLMLCTIHSILEQQLHTLPLWWIEQLKIVSEKTSKQERILENSK